MTVSDSTTHDRTGYTPYAGRRLRGWPETVLVRGDTVIEKGIFKGRAGSGRFLARKGGRSAAIGGHMEPEMDLTRNFGAKLF